MEWLLGFATGVLLTPWAIVALFIFAIIFDRAEWGFLSFVLSVVLVWSASVVFGILPHISWYAVAPLYLVTGIAWSAWRYKRFVEAEVAEFNKHTNQATASAIRHQLYTLAPRNNITRIAYWVLNWPINLIHMTVSDLFDVVERLVRQLAKHIYDKTFASATASLNAELNKFEANQ
jgi:hypothetical protein